MIVPTDLPQLTPHDVVIDNSLLTSVVCSTEGAMRHVLHLTSPISRVEMECGSALHEGLARYLVTGDSTIGLARFDLLYKPWAKANVPPLDKDGRPPRLLWHPVHRILKRWFLDHPLKKFPLSVDPAHVEIPVWAPLGLLLEDGKLRETDVLPDLTRAPKKGRLPVAVFIALLDFIGKKKVGGGFWSGDHKGQPLLSRILTPSGWATMGDLRVGDPIIGRDGIATVVTKIIPLGKKPIYRVTFRDRSFTDCTEDHVWTVRAAGWTGFDTWVNRTLAQLIAAPSYMTWQIPLLSAPVTFSPQRSPLPIDPYILGVLIGDGYLGASSLSLSASAGKQEVVDKVRCNLPPGTSIHKNNGNNHTWNIVGEQHHNPLLDALRTVGLHGKLSAGKFIPPMYLLASIDARKALFAGLLDTDGCCDTTGKIYYDTCSKQLIADVVDLARSLGCIAHARPRSGTKQQAYRATIRSPFNPFTLTRKAIRYQGTGVHFSRLIASIQRLPTPVPAQCIQVAAADGCYVTDSYIVTHNSSGSLGPWFKDQNEDASQFTGQLWAGQQRGLRLNGIFINGLELKSLNSSEKRCPKHGVPYATCALEPEHHSPGLLFPITRTAQELETWAQTAIQLTKKFLRLKARVETVEDIASLPMEGRFIYGKCGRCTFRDFCRLGRTPQAAKGFIKQEWNPLDHAFTRGGLRDLEV